MSEAHAVAYAALRDRVSRLVAGVPEAVLAEACPATPEWSVHDVVAHLVGVTSDVLAGRMEGVATDAWTAAQVAARREVPTGRLLEEWGGNADGFGDALRRAPDAAVGQAIFDAATHEFDIRHALAAPGGRTSDAVAIGWAWLRSARSAPPAVVAATEVGEERFGTGEPIATVRASRFELFRAFTGRRTLAEVEGYDWHPAPRPELLLASTELFSFRTEPLDEA